MAQLKPVVVDTDVAIDFLAGADPGFSAVQVWVERDVARFSAVTAFELRLGTSFVRQEADIMALLAGRVIDFDLASALVAGTVAGELRRRGEEIGHPDSMIAGACLRHGYALATRNLRHFERVPELQLADLANP